MENRNRSRNSYTRYDRYYGTDRNAALAPVRMPLPEPERRPAPRPQARPKPKPQGKKWVAMICLAGMMAAMGCVVVNRNAQIYQNTLEIRRMAKSIGEAELMVKTAEMQLDAGTDVDEYLEIAKDQLNMSYPTAEQTIVIPAAEQEDTNVLETESQERKNLYDAILDWINSLERRI